MVGNNPWDSFLGTEGSKASNGTNVSNKADLPSATPVNTSEDSSAVKEQFENDPVFIREDFKNKYVYDPSILILSASLIRQLSTRWDNLKPCPQRIFRQYIIKDSKTKPTEPMVNGSYFETMGLGSGIRGQMTLNLPTTLKGKKTAANLKIDIQVLRFKAFLKENGIKIITNFNTQIKIYKKYKEHIYISGEIDVFPFSLDGQLYMADLKLTGNVDSTFGYAPWGDPSMLDFIQPDIYLNLVKDIDFKLNDHFNPGNHLRDIVETIKEPLDAGACGFVYWVYGYSCKNEEMALSQQVKTNIERELTDQKQIELKERIDSAINDLKHMRDSEWPTKPDNKECKNCSLNITNGGTCKEGSESLVY